MGFELVVMWCRCVFVSVMSSCVVSSESGTFLLAGLRFGAWLCVRVFI